MKVKQQSITKNIKLLLIFLTLLEPSISYSQSPGGVGTANLTAWLKTDNLTAGNVTSWTTSFPTGGSAITLSDLTSPYPIATNSPAGNTSNYNMTIDFTGNTTNKTLENTDAFNLLDNINSGDEGTLFVSFLSTQTDPNGHLLLYNENSGNGDGIQLRLLTTTMKIAIGKQASNSSNATRNRAYNNTPTIMSYKGNRSGSSTLACTHDDMSYTNLSGASQSTGPRGIYIGSKPGIGSSAYNGYHNELITFNKDLSDIEINKVNTYLAIKFGTTLDNTGGGIQGDYTSTTGLTIWDASDNITYHNDVIGIGRDDLEALIQKQSHTFDDSTRLYITPLAATNLANTGIFSNNESYIVMGHNTGNLCATSTSNTEVPVSCGLNSRLEREWKVTKTNFNQNCNIDFNIGGCGNPNNVDISHLRLLVDNDGNFSNGGTTCYYNGDGTGITITYNNPVITISDISNTHLLNNGTQFITIGSVNSLTPLPIKLTNFSVKPTGFLTAIAEWTTQSETDNDYFVIEKSTNGLDWEIVTKVRGAGNSSSPINYDIYDNRCYFGVSYYRLKQVDFNGDFTYSAINTLNFDDIIGISVYPNPSSNKITVSAHGVNIDDCNLYNTYGQNISSSIIINELGSNQISITTSHLPNGVYLIKVKSFTKKILISH